MSQKNLARVLVLGASGMLGNTVLRFFAQSDGFEVTGSVRSKEALHRLPQAFRQNVVCEVDIDNSDSLVKLFALTRPDVVINCIGLIKGHAGVDDPLSVIPTNSLLPHRLALACEVARARLVHISTDCVFSGAEGMYTESHLPDAQDLYGRSKLMGEVDYAHAVTLRTSIIGHELAGTNSLIEWFLAQSGPVKGFSKAIFSGLPAVELALVMRDYVIPDATLRGVHHVSSEPVNKYDLLQLVARTYGKATKIIADDQVVINRSLDSTKFRQLTGYRPPVWTELVRRMHDFG
ncbi:MAG: SDR family oxidoreductase [Pseudomonadota bacterium]